MVRLVTFLGGVGLGLAAYDEEMAFKLANLAVASNCAPPVLASTQALEAWQCGPACDAVPGVRNVRAVSTLDNDDAFAFVGELDDKCLLVFRGTSNTRGWIMDLESGWSTNLNDVGIECNFDGAPCYGAWGFTQNYANIRGAIMANLTDLGCTSGKQVVVTGHSLGAAEAHLAMYDLSHNGGFEIGQSYSFGAPRAGDTAFVQAFEQEFPLDTLYRVTHYYDPVPHLPPMAMGFQHPPREVWYSGEDVSSGFIECDGTGSDQNCSNRYWNIPNMLANCLWDGVMRDGCDHLTYFNGRLPYQMNGQSCMDPFAVSTEEPVRDGEEPVMAV